MAHYKIGHIIAFSGSIVPANWAFCDGTLGTPDLRNSFILGGNPAAPSAIGTTSGAANHTHSYGSGTGNSAAHIHTRADGTVDDGGGDDTAYSGVGSTTSPASHSHTIKYTISPNTTLHSHSIGTTGSATSIPKNIILNFIMKIS